MTVPKFRPFRCVYGRIYIYANLINGKQYIGQTTMSVRQRFDAQANAANVKAKSAIERALVKHGVEAFSRAELYIAFSKEELDLAEDTLILAYGTLSPHGYNLKRGGSNGKYTDEARANSARAQTGRRHSVASRIKRSIKLKGRKYPDRVVSYETRQKQSVARKGKSRDAAFCRKMKAIAARSLANPEIVASITAGREAFLADPVRVAVRAGKASASLLKHYEQPGTCAALAVAINAMIASPRGAIRAKKIGDAHRGKPKSEEHCLKLSKAKKGKKTGPMSEEHKAAIRAGRLKELSRPGQREKRQQALDSYYESTAAAMRAEKIASKLKGRKRADDHTWLPRAV